MGKAGLRIALLNPNTNIATTAVMAEIARGVAPPWMSIEGLTARLGVPLIMNSEALAAAADAVVAMTDDLADFDGVIVSAFGDPGRCRLAAALSCPITGIAEASMAEASRLSNDHFAIVTTTPDLAEIIRQTADGYGFCDALVAVHTTAGDPAALMEEPKRLQDALAALIETAVQQDGARAVIIGGGPLAVAARTLAPRFAVPIVEPIPAAVALMGRRMASFAPLA